jgi:RHS repeat-associated protein
MGQHQELLGLTLNHATNASGAPATNRISTAVAGSTTYTHTYDAAGNMTSDGQQTFAYDGANRLKSVGAGAQNTYGYDGNGARVRVVANGGLPTFYIRSTVLGQVAFEVNQNMVLRAYVNAAGKTIAQQSRDGQFYWLHTNHLGSGTKLTDSTGAVKSRAEFDPYGQPLLEWSSSGDTYLNTKKFTGYERDTGSGLDYANARMYANGRGRFVQPDPTGLKSSTLKEPLSLNLYAYVKNDPVNLTDPTGLDWIVWVGESRQWLCNLGFRIFCDVFGTGTRRNPETKEGLIALGEWSPGEQRKNPFLTRTVMSPPQAVGKCGSAFYQVEWQIANGGPGVNGWVIQHTIRVITVEDKDGKSIPPKNGARTVDYYEAWRVKDGYVYSGDAPIGLDRWQTSEQGNGTSGTWELVGFAKFIPDSQGIDPSTWGHKVPEAGILYSTYDKPTGWSDRGGVIHDMEVIWDCTGPEPKPPIVR